MCVGLNDLEINAISLLWWSLVNELHWQYVAYGSDLSRELSLQCGDRFEFNCGIVRRYRVKRRQFFG